MSFVKRYPSNVMIFNLKENVERYVSLQLQVGFYSTFVGLDGATFVVIYLMNALSLNYAPERV